MLIFKNALIKIKKQFGRFISLILIVALGAAFFAGVRETSSDMIKTLDEYYDNTYLLDFRIISTMGLTSDDVVALKNLNDNYIVEANYSYDTLINDDATKIYGITSDINKLKLLKGNYPTNDDECLVLDGSYNIGDIITIDVDNYNDYLNNNTFKVVGTVDSSMYIYTNLGTTTVSDGKLDNVIFVNKSVFNLDYYTEIYILDEEARNKISYKNEYDEQIKILNDELEKLAPIQETKRYEEIKTEAMQKIYDAKDKINEEKEKNEKKFNDAKNELDSAQKQINNGLLEIENSYKELEDKKIEVENEFVNQENNLNNSLNLINEKLNSHGIDTPDIDTTITNLNSKINDLNNLLVTLDPSSNEYITCNNLLNDLKTVLSNLESIKNGLISLETGKVEWNKTYNETINTLNENKEKLNSKQITLSEAYDEYNKNYQEFINKINESEQEIKDAEEEINNLEKPEWYLFNREDNSGYTTFYESATKVDSISAVFPLFFIAIAFLMCLNTMTRMIEEERTEIGIFSSLGIGRIKIIISYVIYVLLATLIGILLGLSIGYTVVPRILYKVYSSAFIIPSLNTYVNIPICITIIEVCVLTMIIVSVYAVNRNFKEAPAMLLRPLSPKKGHKVLLEKIPFIWKKFSFSWKVTFRNLFRYKKRIVMTLIGISGCTALLLTGFGIKDSISKITDIQFNDIQKYDSILVLKDSLDAQDSNINDFLIENNIDEPLYADMQTMTFYANKKNIDVYTFGFENNDIDNYFNLTNLDNEPIHLDDNGAIVTQKLAELLNADVGDTITIRDNNNEIYIIKISNIAKNYVNNYIYMTKDYYEIAINKINYNVILANINDLGKTLMDSGYFSSIQYSNDSLDMLNDILNSLNNIVFLIIGFSSFLAITVLYNLTTINISERLREIATLKVLGFNNKEISMYVYRETIILTIIGIGLGMLFGIGLNYFVLTVAEIDEIVFIKDIHSFSYIYTFIIMIIFTIIVQIMTSFILKKINMIDSLKSVE